MTLPEPDPRTLSLAPFDPARYVGIAHAPTWLDPFQGVPEGTPIER